MLGENHSLLNEFPEHKELITKLVSNDQSFAETTAKYDELDAKIRKLELANSPVSDSEMHKMKHERSELKDSLYQRLTSAKASLD
jgi:uncharacterized protein YdcH (DUF465 family)